MSKTTAILFIIVASVAECLGCKKAFAPKIIGVSAGYLVVEGVINSNAGDTTYIKLSRMTPVTSADTAKVEHNAVVTVEGSNNAAYQLSESGNGIYTASLGGLIPNAKYRLHIKTTDNREYLSDYLQAKATPPIDSIAYSVQNNGVQFYVYAHDPTGDTRYYRWDFDETFGYFSMYTSTYKIGPDSLPHFRIEQADKIRECYKTLQSKAVLLGSSAKLSKDEIDKEPVDFITQESGKISHGYSLLVRQYALTADAFNYWQNLKKNTEQIGTIFDAQPSEIQGNIHCLTNPAEPVAGYISASSVTAKRIFLDAQTTGLFVPTYLPPPEAGECGIGDIPVEPQSTFAARLNDLIISQNVVLISGVSPPGSSVITGYTYAWAPCVDCRAKAPLGTNTVPVFWPPSEHE